MPRHCQQLGELTKLVNISNAQNYSKSALNVSSAVNLETLTGIFIQMCNDTVMLFECL